MNLCTVDEAAAEEEETKNEETKNEETKKKETKKEKMKEEETKKEETATPVPLTKPNENQLSLSLCVNTDDVQDDLDEDLKEIEKTQVQYYKAKKKRQLFSQIFIDKES